MFGFLRHRSYKYISLGRFYPVGSEKLLNGNEMVSDSHILLYSLQTAY